MKSLSSSLGTKNDGVHGALCWTQGGVEPPDGIPEVGCDAKPHLGPMAYGGERTGAEGEAGHTARTVFSTSYCHSFKKTCELSAWLRAYSVAGGFDLPGKSVP